LAAPAARLGLAVFYFRDYAAIVSQLAQLLFDGFPFLNQDRYGLLA
jgi:hypothetical protein